jgi:hypothetical protein
MGNIAAGWLIVLSALMSTALSARIYGQNASTAAAGPQFQIIEALSAWDGTGDGEDGDRLSLLFARGETLIPDIVAACHDGDEDLVPKAYLLLRLLGSEKTTECASHVHQEDPPIMLGTSDVLTESAYSKLERIFAPQPCESSRNCIEDDLPLVEESIVYALILDGSPRAKNILNRMSKLAAASHSEDMLGFDVASHAETLTPEARSLAHNLSLDGGTFEQSFRRSLFFLKRSVRDTAEIKLLARNPSDDRMLVTVSYMGGRLSGSGYYIVLSKNAIGTWDYALIMRAWIS